MNEPPLRRGERFAWWLHDRLLAFAQRLTRYTVVLGKDAPIDWPDACLKCGDADASHRFAVTISRASVWSLLAGGEPPWRRRRLEIPMCAACHRRAVRQRWLGRIVPFIVLVTLLLGGLALSQWLAARSARGSALVRLLAVVGSIVTGVVVGVAIGTAFAITERADGTFAFEFEDRDRAEDLAAANDTEVIEPEPISDQ